MGAVALVALLAGGPLGACLAIAYGIVSIAKVAKVDAQYAKNGQVPPTTRLIEKWLDARAAKGAKPAKVKPYGSWAYARQRWSALWETLGDRHRAQYAAEKKARDEAIAAGRPLPKKPSAAEREKSGWRWVIDRVVAPVGERPGTSRPAPVSTPASPAAGGTAGEAMRIACEDCGVTLIDTAGGWKHPDGAHCLPNPTVAPPATETGARHRQEPARPAAAAPICPWCGERAGGLIRSAPPDSYYAWHLCHGCRKPVRDDALTDQQVSAPTSHTATRPAAATSEGETVEHTLSRAARQEIADLQEAGQYNKATALAFRYTVQGEPNRGDTMTQATQQSGEVTGLMSAINYAAAVAAAHEAHSLGGGEQYRASLASADVGPETLQSAASAQEASETAAGAWRAHEAKLREQLAAKEAMTAETGSKQFLLNE